jgi:hypothetical protein
MSKYFPGLCKCILFVIFTIFLQATSLFVFNHLSCISFSLQYFVSFHFNAMNSVYFCSITFRSNQMHYFYYLKLKNYLQYIALIHYKLSLVF